MNAYFGLAAWSAMWDRELWGEVPFAFWAFVLFVFGSMVGSFLNVCIHRMPLGLSLVSPPSHCPHCRYSIPWFLNMPLITWLVLRGRCANCKAPISPRYFLVELLTGVLFWAAWMKYGKESPALVLIYCFVLSGFLVATFIDFAHFIIPDEITLGGIGAGLVCSILFPVLHDQSTRGGALVQGILGAGVGWSITYAILRLGKMLFGKQTISLEPNTRIQFGETSLKIGEEETDYGEMLYRPTDKIEIQAKEVETGGRKWQNARVSLSLKELRIGEEVMDPEKVTDLVVVTDAIVIPREAMGLGDVKFIGAIGAFLGWKGALFSLLASSVIGSFCQILLILCRKKEWSGLIPYGPYIAIAATVWIYAGRELLAWWVLRMG